MLGFHHATAEGIYQLHRTARLLSPWTCLAVVRPGTYEADILKHQYLFRKGVFDKRCQDTVIISTEGFCKLLRLSREACPSRNPASIILSSLPSFPTGGNTSMNLSPFVEVLRMLWGARSFNGAGWVIKVDMDTVWSPERLFDVIAQHSGDAAGKDALHLRSDSPLQVWSYGAMRALQAGVEACKWKQLSDNISQDLLLWRCFEYLGVRGFPQRCGGMEPPSKCPWEPQYHPCKSIDAYLSDEVAYNNTETLTYEITPFQRLGVEA